MRACKIAQEAQETIRETRKWQKWIERIRKGIWILFGITVGCLLIASVFGTCDTGELEYLTQEGVKEINREHTFFMGDMGFQHLLVFALFSLLLAKIPEREAPSLSKARLLFAGIFSLITIGMISMVMCSQYYPKYDQRSVMETAAALRQGDLSVLEPDGYLFLYPHQKGIVLYFMILSCLFGNLNYVAFELVNVIWIAGSFILLARLGGKLWSQQSRQTEIRVSIVCLLFFPYWFYASYLYGTVIGSFLILLAFYFILLWNENGKWRCLIIGSVSAALAVIMKSNFQIFIIALVLYLLFSALAGVNKGKRKAAENILAICAVLLCVFLGNYAMESWLTRMNQGTEIEGLPMITYVAMGLQDGKSAPGWYNGYNVSVYRSNQFDAERTSAQAWQDILRTISRYPEDISASISFFAKKILSQWINPSFQSLWLLEERNGLDGLHWILEGTGRKLYLSYTNLLQTWIYAGTFLFVLFRFQKGNWEETLLILTFLGGFVFHIFWEAKSMYAMPFFLLLLPLCVCGYQKWRRFLRSAHSFRFRDLYLRH